MCNQVFEQTPTRRLERSCHNNEKKTLREKLSSKDCSEVYVNSICKREFVDLQKETTQHIAENDLKYLQICSCRAEKSTKKKPMYENLALLVKGDKNEISIYHTSE